MAAADAEGDVQQRCTSLRGQPDDTGAAQSGEAGCRAGRKPVQAPPRSARMRAYLRWRPLVSGLGSAPVPEPAADDHRRGPAGAPLVIEYADFECPFCAALHERL